jgi:hypothetical protein
LHFVSRILAGLVTPPQATASASEPTKRKHTNQSNAQQSTAPPHVLHFNPMCCQTLLRMHLRFSAAKHIEHRMSVSIPTSITNHIFPAASCVACCLPPFLLGLLLLFFLRFA